jgi:hypothetical protein
MSLVRTYSKNDRIHIYNLLLEIVEVADSTISDLGVYSEVTGSLRAKLLDLYDIRLVHFRDVSCDGYIADMPYDDQILFVLFCAQMVLTDDIPEGASYEQKIPPILHPARIAASSLSSGSGRTNLLHV